MTREEILHLGSLARIRMSETEADQLNTEINAILEYVSEIDALVDAAALQKQVGPVYNVFREDEVTNTPEEHTEALLEAMPERSGRFMRVQKILENKDA